MIKQFIGCAPENFFAGRKTSQPEAIVIHEMESLDEADMAFSNASSALSAHYAINAEGVAHQYVEEKDSAFHAGVVISPVWTLIKPGVNPNLYTIGIAGAAPGGIWSEPLYASLAELVNETAGRWRIPIDAEHIVLHSEIRASKKCPGSGFNGAVLLARLKAMTPPEEVTSVDRRFVNLLRDSNLRDAPSRTARVLKTLLAGGSVDVTGFTNNGARINGNASWYETSERAFLWAGNTDQPQPVGLRPERIALPASSAPPPPRAFSAAAPRGSGIARIDGLLAAQAAAIDANDGDRAAVGAVQDLLLGHGFRKLPGILGAAHGTFGNATATAVREFQSRQGVPATGAVDALTLQKMIVAPAVDPRVTQAYLTLVLKQAFAGMQKVLSITAQMEGAGKFGAVNRNTDRCGLSYGLIQWAQRPGRLPEILRAFSRVNRQRFVSIFGDGDALLADGLIEYVSRPNGGLDRKTGLPFDLKFDLIEDPWLSRFRRATLELEFQRAQLDVSTDVFTNSYRQVKSYASEIASERGAAFMLDVANQCGDAGLQRIYLKVRKPGMTEMDIMEAISDETIHMVDDNLQAGVRHRRDSFLETSLLFNEPVDLLTSDANV